MRVFLGFLLVLSIGLMQACGANLPAEFPAEFRPPEDKAARVAWWLENGGRACAVADALGLQIKPEYRPICDMLRAPTISAAPSGTGPDAGAATPVSSSSLGGSASNGVRSVGGGGG